MTTTLIPPGSPDNALLPPFQDRDEILHCLIRIDLEHYARETALLRLNLEPFQYRISFYYLIFRLLNCDEEEACGEELYLFYNQEKEKLLQLEPERFYRELPELAEKMLEVLRQRIRICRI